MASVSMCVNILRWLPVVFVLFLFIWSSYTYIVQMCFYMVTNIIERVIYLVVFCFLLSMSQWCFFKAIFTEVAVVPLQYFLTADEKELASQGKTECNEIIETKGTNLRVQGRTIRGCVRYCEQCKCIKPDRAHHCSTCQKCVLKMDHHCPWINNCVGYSNYKFFFLFITYSFVLCLYITATSCQYFIMFWAQKQKQKKIEPPDYGGISVVMMFFISLVVIMSLFALLSFHIDILIKNRTTLESLRAPSFRSGPDKNAYNKGCRKNFIEVFGKSPLKWFIPVFTDTGDGVTYTARISPIPIGYRSMENSTLVNLGNVPKIETKSVPVQPNKISGLNTENASNSSQREIIALKALNQAVQSQVTAERIKRFM